MPIRMTPEGTKFLSLTQDKMQFLWEKFNTIPGILDDSRKGNYNAFIAMLTAPQNLWLELEDGEGVIYATSVVPNLAATAHFAFFDKTLRGREQLLIDVLKWLTESAKLQKVNVYMPDFTKSLHRFVRRLGFKQEGVLRRWGYDNHRLYDVLAYGMTREEILNGTRSFQPVTARTANAEFGVREQPVSDELPKHASTADATA